MTPLSPISPTKRDAQVRAVATEFLRLRPWVVGPFFGFALAVFAAVGMPPRQLGLVAGGTSAFMAFFLWERSAGRRRIIGRTGLTASLLVTIAGITIATTLTGATASPLLPMLFAPVGVGFAAFGRERESTWLLLALATVTIALCVVAPAVTQLSVAEPGRRVVLVAAVLDAALLLRVGVASLAAAHARAGETLAIAGDELVRASEARARRTEALGARVAHEVKNPLSAIRALVEVMLETAADRDKRRLSVAAAEVARIEAILDRFASLAHPFDEIERRVVDVSELVHALVEVLAARAERAGVALTVDPPDRARVDASIDRDRVTEALLNLVLNALDATPDGGRVTIAYRVAGGRLDVEIADTGVGMNQATLSKIGTPYFTQRDGGTGLGVAVAKHVASMHGGRLLYDSEPGRGTRASLQLPSEAPDADRAHL